MQVQMCGGQITLSKIEEICPLAIPNQISNINAQTKFGENPLIFTQIIAQKRKYRRVTGR